MSFQKFLECLFFLVFSKSLLSLGIFSRKCLNLVKTVVQILIHENLVEMEEGEENRGSSKSYQ